VTHITYFRGGKTDVFPSSSIDTSDLFAWIEQHAYNAPGCEKGENGFVCFVRMKPGTDVTVAEINLARAKEEKPPLNSVQEECVRTRGYRNYAHVAEVTAIGIDYDEFPNEPPNWDPEVWPCDVFAHTTHNWTRLTPGKWRVILPLATPMPVEREAQLRKVLQDILPRGCMVRAPHQPAFLPTCPADMTCEVKHVEQTEIPNALDWTKLIDMQVEATVHATGIAAGTLIGAEFDKRGMVARDCGTKLDVECPWASEHKSGGSLGFVYYTEDGLGKFGCAHGACKGRGSAEVFEYFDGTPDAVIPEPLSVSNGQDGEEATQPAGLGELVAQPVKAEASNFPLMTAEDMLAGDEPIPWVVEGLVSVGEPTLVVGGAGSGKTSAMVDLALAVASGREVWGMFRVAKPGPVVHIDYEQGKTLRRTYLAFAKGMGLDAAQMVRDGSLRIATLPKEQLLDANVTDKHLSGVGKDILKLCRGASVCVINSLTAGTNKVNENDAKIAAVFNLLARITELTGCAFIVLHHSGRGELTRARGSSAIDGAVQTIFQISHKKGQTFTTWEHTKDRPAGGLLDKFKLNWKNNDGVQTLTGSVIEPPPPPAPGAERPEDRIASSILFVMENKALGVKSRILECVRGKKALKEQVFADLIVKGLIEHVGARYILGAGVVAPKVQPPGVREGEDEDQ
jgi:hypothetical protein